MTREVLIALTTLSSAGAFLAVVNAKAEVADNYWGGFVLWALPAFGIAMAFAALCLGVFYPAVKLVAALVT